jgi:5-carboxymethyl-2-hydroxymuconic-semialdehyde dehydrogenase
VEAILWSAFGTSGQRCTAASRVIAHEKIYDPLQSKLVAATERLRLGPGWDDASDVGPVINRAAIEKIHAYTKIGSDEGARLLTGGEIATDGDLGKGFFYRPTVFGDVDAGMRIAQEEIFGPVACLIPFDNEADAIRLANDIPYGLSSYIWTENTGRAHRVAAAVEAGMCFVNSQNVRDLRQPFGGTKASGVGREGGTWSYEVFLEPKNVCLSLGSHHIPRWGA